MPQKQSVNIRQHVRRRSLRTTLFFESFALLALTVFLVSIVAFFLSGNELKIRTTSQLESIAEGKEVLLESTVSKQREQLSILGRDDKLSGVPSVTTLIGFRQLVLFDTTRTVTILAGEKNESQLTKEILSAMSEHEGTVFRPIITEAGWMLYVIAAPQMKGVIRTGTLIATFDAMELAARVFQTDSAARTTEVLLATTIGNQEVVLRADGDHIVPVIDIKNTSHSIVREALLGQEGVADTIDYSGIPVLAAYRSIPSLGWAVIAKVDTYEVRAPTVRLATNLAGTGLMIIAFLSLSTFFLGRRIVGPLEELSEKLNGIEARHWKFARSIFTGNELEIVDSAADELTKRLRKSHEHLESLVAERTKELQKEHAEDAAILESMDDGLVVTDAKGMITYINHMAEILIGQTNLCGKHVEDALHIGDKEGHSLEKTHHPINEVLAKKIAYHPLTDPELTLQKSDGSHTALQIRVTPILRGKECMGSVAVIRDITEERHIDRMKSEFITLVSHQLRTPLSSMRWYLEMLITEDAGPLSEDQREYIGQVATSNARMVHLVNALLNVSRIELGKIQVSAETIELEKLIRSVASSFDLETKQKKITLEFDLPKNPISIRSDKSLIELIVENFLSNAIKYSQPESSVRINVHINTEGNEAILSVIDTGMGIPEIQKGKIGQKLFRGNNAKASDTDGNGLGIYISKIAAETIGAKLTFESAENKGTTFFLAIPFNQEKSS